MGLLVEGQWMNQAITTKGSGGKFMRSDAGFRNWITSDGSAGAGDIAGFKAESGRYHLYISHACPWANRAAIFRVLKDLESHISTSVVDYFMGDEGWTFDGEEGGATKDHINGFDRLHKVYTASKPDYTGRVTVPILWDLQTDQIVSNESSEIIRMFNSEFNELTGNNTDFYPHKLREEIDVVNEKIYHTLNNGVYKCGFATSQNAYEEAFHPLFDTLDYLENRLTTRRYLTGRTITEADWRLFTTLIRFDSVYVGHFKCNRNRIADFPNLSNYTRELYQWPGVAQTINMQHIKDHYYGSHETVNPTRIVPMGPEIDYSLPHNRSKM